MPYENYNRLRDSIELRIEIKEEKENKTYIEQIFAEVLEYEYLGNSPRLKSVKVNQILDLENYIKTGESEKRVRLFEGSAIPEALRFYINHRPSY